MNLKYYCMIVKRRSWVVLKMGSSPKTTEGYFKDFAKIKNSLNIKKIEKLEE